jgi:HAE1 family hydrophobic/amphiphilic exporter-1
MVAATLLTLIFVPVFYALIERAREGREAAAAAAAPHAGAHLAPRAEAAE